MMEALTYFWCSDLLSENHLHTIEISHLVRTTKELLTWGNAPPSPSSPSSPQRSPVFRAKPLFQIVSIGPSHKILFFSSQWKIEQQGSLFLKRYSCINSCPWSKANGKSNNQNKLSLVTEMKDTLRSHPTYPDLPQPSPTKHSSWKAMRINVF